MAENGLQREMDDVRKLAWKIGWVLLVLGGGGFGLLWNASAGQDEAISKMISRDVMIEYKTDNNREHEKLDTSIGKIDDKVDKIQGDVREMKGMLEQLTK